MFPEDTFMIPVSVAEYPGTNDIDDDAYLVLSILFVVMFIPSWFNPSMNTQCPMRAFCKVFHV